MNITPEPAPAPAPPPVVGPAPSNAFGFPVAWIAVAQAAVYMALSFGWLDAIGLHSQNDLGVVMLALNAVSALFLAYKTRGTLLAPAVEAFKATAGVFAIYGFHMNTEHTAAVLVVITALAAAFHHEATSPLVQGSLDVAA